MVNLKMDELLTIHPTLKRTSNGRVICNATYHEMPDNVAAVQSYLAGKRYARGKKMFDIMSKYDKFLKDNGEEYYCLLTNKLVAKTPESLGSHVSGKRFKKMLAKYESTGVLPDYRDRDRLAPKPEEPTMVVMPSDNRDTHDDAMLDVDKLSAMIDSSEDGNGDDVSDVEEGSSSGVDDMADLLGDNDDDDSDYDFDIMMNEDNTIKENHNDINGDNKISKLGSSVKLIEGTVEKMGVDVNDIDNVVEIMNKKRKRRVQQAADDIEMEISTEVVADLPLKKKRKRKAPA